MHNLMKLLKQSIEIALCAPSANSKLLMTAVPMRPSRRTQLSEECWPSRAHESTHSWSDERVSEDPKVLVVTFLDDDDVISCHGLVGGHRYHH